MISKPVKRFVELMKSNPDDFDIRRIYSDCPYNLVFNDKRHEDNSELLENRETEEDPLNILYPHWSLKFHKTNWIIGLYLFGRETKYNLNIVERLFLKRNLKIHLNIEPYISLLFPLYQAKFLVLKNSLWLWKHTLFLFFKNILNIKKHAWIISILIQIVILMIVSGVIKNFNVLIKNISVF
tara:strand:+ start:165 stop:710 length:546 start_codon:yes stop_codon:yes gene_type:complete